MKHDTLRRQSYISITPFWVVRQHSGNALARCNFRGKASFVILHYHYTLWQGNVFGHSSSLSILYSRSEVENVGVEVNMKTKVVKVYPRQSLGKWCHTTIPVSIRGHPVWRCSFFSGAWCSWTYNRLWKWIADKGSQVERVLQSWRTQKIILSFRRFIPSEV